MDLKETFRYIYNLTQFKVNRNFAFMNLENLKHFFISLYGKAFDDDMFSRAAQVAFYFSFAIFPLLLFLLTLFGIFLSSAEEFRLELFLYLRQIMPVSAFELVQSTIKEVMEQSSGGKLTIGLLIALWSASAGIDSLRIALNNVYNLKETRPWWKTKSLSLILTLVIGALISIAIGIIFYGSQIFSSFLPIESGFILKILNWITILIIMLLAFGILYSFSPNHKPFHWRWNSPGAIAGIILWLLLSFGFRTYLQYFDSYAKTYGSLGAMIILMLWLYLTALVILIGGAINAIFDEFWEMPSLNQIKKHLKQKKQTTSEEK
jgi:membrane protein